jgi:prolyl-tRNA editing enzyme YbaK/EbsC (Cys-tRNA(Pro) deacylase)
MMPVYMEKTVLDLERVYINGGKRGYLVSMTPGDVQRMVEPVLVQIGITDP